MKTRDYLNVVLGFLLFHSLLSAEELKPSSFIDNEITADPDDMCFVQFAGKNWLIASDKAANAVFLFNPAGKIVDQQEVAKPGNIDARQRFSLTEDSSIPLVVTNGREAEELVGLTLRKTGEGVKLLLLKGEMPTGPNYGGCLYQGRNGKTYFFSTTKGGLAQQFEVRSENGTLASKRVRAWQAPICEGAVADDRHQVVFVCEEQVGIRKLGAEPNDAKQGELIVRVGDHGIQGDLEGITMVATGKDTGFLIASDQGQNQFVVFQREAPHEYVGGFSVKDVQHTDGVDVTTLPFGKFGRGVIACHSDNANGCRIVLTPLKSLLQWTAR